MAQDKKKKPLIQKQKPMTQVILAILPLAAASVYFYGWRAVVVLAVVNIAGFLSEYVFVRQWGQSVSMAVFVTNFLFALSLPPNIPLWIAVVGIVFGVVFGKMVFGGFGKNVYNPALTGRAFIYASFGAQMTGDWYMPFSGGIGGFAHWAPGVDAATSATPLAVLNGSAQGTIDRLSLFLGNISGSLGETSALLIILGGLFLIWKKTASWHIIVSVLVSFSAFQTIFHFAGVPAAGAPLDALLAGSILYGAVFMATDPVSSSQTTNIGRVIYGSLIGMLTVLIRVFAAWPEAITFAILLANTFAPLLNHLIKEYQRNQKLKKAAKAGAA